MTTLNVTTSEGDSKTRAKEVFRMAWPAVTESFFVAFTGMVDALMVSGVGSHAVAAVGLTTQPKFIALAPFIAMNVAVSALVARRRGQNDRYSANQMLVMALLFVAAAGILVSAFGIIFASGIMRFCGSALDTHEGATRYFSIIVGGMLPNIISLTINAAQRGAGNTKIALKTNVTANVVNMIGNYLLIDGHFGFPAMGIEGAALATVFGTFVACCMSILSIVPKANFVCIPYIIQNKVKPKMREFTSMFRIAANIFVEQLLVRIGFITVAIMAAKQGTDALAAHQVGMQVMSLSFSFGEGMQVAAVALIGRSLGEQKPEIARLYGRICRRMGNGISVVLSVLYLTCGGYLYRLFFEEPHIIAMGEKIMQIMVVIVLFQVAQVIYMGCLRGAGDVLFTTIASTFSVTLVRPAFSYLFCYVAGLGVFGIWMGVVVDQVCRFSLTNWRFRSDKWTKVNL